MRRVTSLELPVKGDCARPGPPGTRNPNRLFYERYDGIPLTVEYRQKHPGIAK